MKLTEEEMAAISAAIYFGLESGKLTAQAAKIAAEFSDRAQRYPEDIEKRAKEMN